MEIQNTKDLIELLKKLPQELDILELVNLKMDIERYKKEHAKNGFIWFLIGVIFTIMVYAILVNVHQLNTK